MNVSAVINFLTGFFILSGALLLIVAAIGIIRMPDVYTRNHAAAKAPTLAVMSILLGSFLYFYTLEGRLDSRLILGIVFILMTSPVAGHLINRAAYYSGIKMWDKSVRDDLSKSKKFSSSNKPGEF